MEKGEDDATALPTAVPEKSVTPGSVTARAITDSRSSVTPPPTKPVSICVKFTENNSKSWDGKVIAVEADWLEELYPNEKLEVGKAVSLPWESKGQTRYWKAVVVDQEEMKAVQQSNKRKKGTV